MTIQEFATNVSITICPDHWVEPAQLRKFWRRRGTAELQKYFQAGYSIEYNNEIDWRQISEHKKQLWYESINRY